MAEAAEGCGAAGSPEAELTSPICPGLYQEPVSLGCGHSLFQQCIEKVLGAQQSSQGPSTCPICRAHPGPTPELQKDGEVGNSVEEFQAATSKGGEARGGSLEPEEGAEQGEAGVVPCEHCLDGPQPALKTCLVCEASLCQAHLSKHNAKRFHQEHVLVEVGAGQAEERMCGDHGKLLECYCVRDETCICILCFIAGTHKDHEVTTMKEGHDKQLVKLFDTVTELQERKSRLVTALEELQERENQIKINAETLTSELKELFDDIETKLHEKKMTILSDIRSHEEEQLAVIADVRKKMEQKTDQAEQNLQALQKIRKQTDVFLFFKDLKPVTDGVASLDLDTESVEVRQVELDNKIFTRYKARQEKLMLQLDSLLNNVRDKFTGLNGEEQEQESIIMDEQDKYFWNNLLGNFDSSRPMWDAYNGHMKKRPWE